MSQRPPQRPSPRPALQRPAMLGAAGNVATPTQAKSDRTDIDDLMQQFNAALQDMQGDPALDPATRTMLQQQFAQAMSEMGKVEGAIAGIPDRAMWMDAIQALQASGEVSESEVNDLIRQINQALQPLQRRESQIAIEFSRRLQTDGEADALTWFRQETAKLDAEDGEHAHSPAPAAHVSPALRSDVVNSRSRRLRGPPQQK